LFWFAGRSYAFLGLLQGLKPLLKWIDYVGAEAPTHKSGMGTLPRHCSRVWGGRGKPRPYKGKKELNRDDPADMGRSMLRPYMILRGHRAARGLLL